MTRYEYLIIGGGMTADAAVQGIREVDPGGTIGVVSSEPDAPYDRPPLTKSLWKDKPLESVWRCAARKEAVLHLGHRAEKLDVWRRQVTDNTGTVYGFEKLLLATGGRPRRLPFGGENILYYRTVQDYRQLRAMTEQGRRFAVLGGGFIGSELAAALVMNKQEVVLLFPDEGISARVFPPDLAKFVTEYYRQRGCEVMTGQTARALEPRGGSLVLETSQGRELTVDGVVAGLGIEPQVELAEQAGLRLENGIVVDEFLETSHPAIYAAGDAAAFYNPALRRRVRVEHEDNANTMGRWAGRNMAGNPQRYTHLPFFYSDLFDLGYEAVGETDARLETVADWQEPFRKGVVYYLHERRIRGVLLWNVWGQVEAARNLIAERRQFAPEELREQHLLKAA
jgi:3-phenylpropionate/trans-cinnamate dioxygenase ferredoxin reductase component